MIRMDGDVCFGMDGSMVVVQGPRIATSHEVCCMIQQNVFELLVEDVSDVTLMQSVLAQSIERVQSFGDRVMSSSVVGCDITTDVIADRFSVTIKFQSGETKAFYVGIRDVMMNRHKRERQNQRSTTTQPKAQPEGPNMFDHILSEKYGDAA